MGKAAKCCECSADADAAEGEAAEDDAAADGDAEEEAGDDADGEKAEDDAAEEEKAEDDAADGEDKEELPEGCVIEEKTGYAGNDIKQGDKPFKEDVEDQKACAKLAAANKKAKFWTYNPSNKKCFIKTSKAGKKPSKTSVSGNRECGL